MSLLHDVSFDSLGAVREEIRLWLGSDAVPAATSERNLAARDTLVSVLIHTLAEELSDVRVRAQIQALLSQLNKTNRGDGRR